jgi:hypothetical protein
VRYQHATTDRDRAIAYALDRFAAEQDNNRPDDHPEDDEGPGALSSYVRESEGTAGAHRWVVLLSR